MTLLNGYKTYLGGLMIILSAILPVFGIPFNVDALLHVGEGLSIIGIGHKFVKANGI